MSTSRACLTHLRWMKHSDKQSSLKRRQKRKRRSSRERMRTAMRKILWDKTNSKRQTSLRHSLSIKSHLSPSSSRGMSAKCFLTSWSSCWSLSTISQKTISLKTSRNSSHLSSLDSFKSYQRLRLENFQAEWRILRVIFGFLRLTNRSKSKLLQTAKLKMAWWRVTMKFCNL